MHTNPLEKYPLHNIILTKLFKNFGDDRNLRILDAGSGRTSLLFLTKNFPKAQIEAIVYPKDERKKKGIKESVPFTNYILKEEDITKFKQEHNYDIVLAHLLLGEATKFGNNSFEGVLDSLFEIKTKVLAIVDIKADPDVNFRLIINKAKENGSIEKEVRVGKYIGYIIHLN